MKKKDHIRIAHAIAQSRYEISNGYAVNDGYRDVIFNKVIDNLIAVIDDGDKFDRERFRAACNLNY